MSPISKVETEPTTIALQLRPAAHFLHPHPKVIRHLKSSLCTLVKHLKPPKCITMIYSVGFKFSLGFGYKYLNTLIKLFQADSMTYMVLGCHINLGLFTLVYSSCVLTLDALLWCRWECLILAWTFLLAFFLSTSCLHNINKQCAFVHACPQNNHGCRMNECILLTSIVMCRFEVGITLERTLELYQSR
jgi:hypothetical protein